MIMLESNILNHAFSITIFANFLPVNNLGLRYMQTIHIFVQSSHASKAKHDPPCFTWLNGPTTNRGFNFLRSSAPIHRTPSHIGTL